jgi:hypothetical protein
MKDLHDELPILFWYCDPKQITVQYQRKNPYLRKSKAIQKLNFYDDKVKNPMKPSRRGD